MEVESEEVVLENEEEREVEIVEAVSENVQASDFQKEVVVPDIDNELPFEIGDVVHVVILCEETDDPESYYYLKDFVGKVGTIQRVIEYPNLQYEAVFGNRVACLYAREVRYGKA